jgi:zeaxanthin epoxidase
VLTRNLPFSLNCSEDAYVIAQELTSASKRSEVPTKLKSYQSRRLIRSAVVQGLSRFASDIIIRGFDTPAKIVRDEATGQIRFENFNYAGIVTKMMQPILPIFFSVQFNFLYDGWKNESSIDLPAAIGFVIFGGILLLLSAGSLGEAGIGLGLGADALFGTEGLLDFDAISSALRDFF